MTLISFQCCKLKLQVDCPEVLSPLVHRMVGGFAPAGAGEYRLELSLASSRGEPSRPKIELAEDAHQGKLLLVSNQRKRIEVRIGKADEFVVSAAMTFLLVRALLDNQGLLLHGAFLVKDGGAHLFLGRSGAGKTTLCRNVSHARVIHDDKVAVRCLSGQWTAFSVPLVNNRGESGDPVSAPVRAIYLIAQGGRLLKIPLNRAQALFLLPEHVIVPFADRRTRAWAFNHLMDLVRECSVWSLPFAKDSDVSRLL